MRKNLLKQLILALLITVAVPTLTAQVHVGDILCEGNAIISPANYPSSGATAIGVVFYVDNTGQHGWAVALEDALENAGVCIWGPQVETPLPNFTNERQAIYDLDGYHNTQIILEYSNGFPAFNAVDFENGWYLPAIGQLNYLYGNIVEVNKSLTELGGMVFPVTDWHYWSSTEYSSQFAWLLHSSGHLDWYTYRNGFYYRVRAVRNF